MRFVGSYGWSYHQHCGAVLFADGRGIWGDAGRGKYDAHHRQHLRGARRSRNEASYQAAAAARAAHRGCRNSCRFNVWHCGCTEHHHGVCLFGHTRSCGWRDWLCTHHLRAQQVVCVAARAGHECRYGLQWSGGRTLHADCPARGEWDGMACRADACCSIDGAALPSSYSACAVDGSGRRGSYSLGCRKCANPRCCQGAKASHQGGQAAVYGCRAICGAFGSRECHAAALSGLCRGGRPVSGGGCRHDIGMHGG